MKIITEKISLSELRQMAQSKFGDMVKAVVDIKRQLMAVDADLHADEESLLLLEGSSQEDLWGINLYPEVDKEHWVEFDSMINLRPTQGNRTRGVDDLERRKKILSVVEKLIDK